MKKNDFSWITAVLIGLGVSLLTFGCFAGFIQCLLEEGPAWIITTFFMLGIWSLFLSFYAVWYYTKWYYAKKDKE